MYRFHRRLASFARVIRLDQRGIGLSSRVPSLDMIGPKFWAKDAIAVHGRGRMRAGDDFRPGFHLDDRTRSRGRLPRAGEQPGDHQRRGPHACALPTTRWAPRSTTIDPYTTVAIEPDAVDQGFDMLGIIAPSVAHDDAFRAWWDMAGNRAASPSMARAIIKTVRQGDVRDTLRAHHRADADPASRRLRASAPSGTVITSPSTSPDHASSSCRAQMPCTGSATPRRCSTRSRSSSPACAAASDAERVLTTIVFTDIVGSTERAALLGDDRWRDLLDNHDTIVRHELQRFGGREVNTAGDGFVATFSSPSAAIACADAIVDAVRVLGIEVRVGIHAGEVEVRGA